MSRPRRAPGAGRGLAGTPHGPGRGRYARNHAHAYPQPLGQRLPSRPGVRALLRADVCDRDHPRDSHHPAPLAAHGRRSWARRGRRAVGGAGLASSAAGSTSTSPRRSTSRITGTGSSRSGTAGWASGAGSHWARPPGSGGCAGTAPTAGCSPTRSPPPCWWRRRSAGSATTSTRNCSAGRPACRGDCTSRRAHRLPRLLSAQTFQPTFLYELIFDLALAAALVWLGHHRGIKAPGLFALYVTGYSAFRIFEESLRVDPSEHFLGLRLNMYVAIAGTIAGGVWFWYTQRYGKGVPATDGAVARAPPGRGERCRGGRCRGQRGGAACRAAGSRPVRRQPRSGRPTAADRPPRSARTRAAASPAPAATARRGRRGRGRRALRRDPAGGRPDLTACAVAGQDTLPRPACRVLGLPLEA